MATSLQIQAAVTEPQAPLAGPRFREALGFAARLHERQLRKGTQIPYVAHLMAVASLALEHGADEETAIAALLHDAVEDQGGQATREKIRSIFGDRVAAIVDGCSDSDQKPKPPWRERKEQYIAHLPQATPDVLLVSACDKLHNARCVLADYRVHGEATWSRFNGGRDGTLWYYRTLVDTFRTVGATVPAALLDELERVVTELERLAAGQAVE